MMLFLGTSPTEHKKMANVMHLGPIEVHVYADGYIAAGMTACGRGHCEQTEKELACMSLVISEVTCKLCMKSRLFKTAEGVAKSSVTEIPRMRTAVYRARGMFDESWNRKLRLWLGLPENSVTPAERATLLATEDEIHADYAARRARRGFT